MVAQAEKLSRRQRDRLRHKDEILAVALKLFSERGYHSVSVQEIAEAAEFSVGTLYNLFESKEALFDELMAINTQRVMDDIMAILDGPGDEVERLRSLFRSQPRWMGKHAAFLKLHFAELAPPTAGRSRSERAKDEFRTVADARVSQLIASGIAKGRFRKVDPLTAAKAIHAFMESMVFEIAGDFNEQEVVDIFAKAEQLFLDGLLLSKDQRDDQ